MPIVIPPRGSKPQPVSTVKRVPILPPKVGSQPAAQVANPTIIVAKAEVDSSLFNRSVLPQSKTTPNLPIPIELTKVWTPQQTGITTTLEELLKIYPPPLRADGREIVPYPWQHEDINALIGWDRVGVFLPVGAGKTLVLTYTALGWGAQIYIVVLLPILIPQWVKWLNAIPDAGPAVAYKGTPKQREEIDLLKHRWWVMSYGIYKNDFNKLMKLLLKFNKYGVLVDECFPSGTQVLTPEGLQEIQTLKVGDEVLTSSKTQKVLHVFESLAYHLVKLELTDGRQIICTPNHPIFTDQGWLAAEDCEGRGVLLDSALRDVRQGVQEEVELDGLFLETSGADRSNLLSLLRSDSKDAVKPSEYFSFARRSPEGGSEVSLQTETSQTAERGAQIENLTESERSNLQTEGRERNRPNTCGTGFNECITEQGFCMELCDLSRSQSARVSNELQSGLRPPGIESTFRGGRQQSSQSSSSGQKERAETVRVRVARVSRIECDSPVAVYNLEVENCPHYFAEGVLVHNCHNIKNTESKNFKLISRMTAGQNLALATGTELNNPGDAYAYCKIKTPGVYRSYQQFMNIHVAKEDFFGKPLEWQHTDLMNRNLYLQSVQRTKEEVQKHLPRAKYMPLEYELESAHAKLYKELAEQQILKLEDGGKIDATTQQTLWNHMQQIILNWNQYAGRTDLRPAAFDVIDMLREQLDFDNMKTKRKFIIWTWYQQSTEVVRDYLEGLYPGRVAVAYGKSNSDKGFARFKDDPECWWMVAQPLSAGAGVEPQYVCYNCLFLETPTRTIPFRQAAGRLDRDGQSESANIWIGIAKGTIQETLYENLLNNDALVQQVQKNPRDIRKMIYGGPQQ